MDGISFIHFVFYPTMDNIKFGMIVSSLNGQATF